MDEQRIVASHFQSQNLLRERSKRLVKCFPCSTGSRKKQTVKLRITGDRFANIATAVNQIQDAFWQSRLHPFLHHPSTDGRSDFAWFKNDRVPGNQSWNDMTVG